MSLLPNNGRLYEEPDEGLSADAIRRRIPYPMKGWDTQPPLPPLRPRRDVPDKALTDYDPLTDYYPLDGS